MGSVITELIVGYMLPGKPVAMMIFKTFGYISELFLVLVLQVTLMPEDSNDTSFGIRL
jgi:hypothetical protein